MKKKLDSLKKEVANLKEERNEINAKWVSEKEMVENVQASKEAIEKYKLEAEQAERDGDYGKVAEIRYGKIKHEQDILTKLQKELAENQDSALIKEEVTRDDIAEIVAKWTGIPVTKMLQSEQRSCCTWKRNCIRELLGRMKPSKRFLML